MTLTSKMLQQLDLPQRPFRQNFLAEHIGDFLDGDPIVRLAIHGSAVNVSSYQSTPEHSDIGTNCVPNNTVSALPQLLVDCVPLVANELLIEHLEYLAAGQVRHCCLS